MDTQTTIANGNQAVTEVGKEENIDYRKQQNELNIPGNVENNSTEERDKTSVA